MAEAFPSSFKPLALALASGSGRLPHPCGGSWKRPCCASYSDAHVLRSYGCHDMSKTDAAPTPLVGVRASSTVRDQ